jgi:hypothetical protein
MAGDHRYTLWSTWRARALEEILGKADEPFLMEGADQIGADLLLARGIQLTR